MTTIRTPALRSDRGSALILALLVTSALMTFGVMLAAVAETERAIAGHFRLTTQTRAEAEAIAERVVADLTPAPEWTDYLSGARRSSFFDASARPTTPYGESLDLVALTARVQTESDRAGTWGADGPRWRLVASGPFATLVGAGESLAYVMAWIADDPDDGDGNPNADANGVVTLRARARGPLGAERDVLVTVARACERSGQCDGSGAAVRVLSWRELQ